MMVTEVQPELDTVAAEIEAYIERYLFDPTGILYAYIDSHTNEPFDPAFITPEKVPWPPAQHDAWGYWTYEDSIMSMGLYLDGLMRKHALTRDDECLHQAREIWRSVRDVYTKSQAHGAGAFLRPYGGLEQMHNFNEPLGTDQASTLFAGAYLYWDRVRAADAALAGEIADTLIGSLAWYEQQGFSYLYYQWFQHTWTFGGAHATSYYLPAIAFAARVTGEKRWNDHLEHWLAWFATSGIALHQHPQGAMCWGSDLVVLKELLGADRFASVVPQSRINQTYETCATALATHYTESRRTARLGHGRHWPMHEPSVLSGLAMLGHRDAAKEARRLLAARSAVPRDFCQSLSEDYDTLPPTSHLWARAAGRGMLEWFRNYWMLQQAAQLHT
jgi:hypothetical protein